MRDVLGAVPYVRTYRKAKKNGDAKKIPRGGGQYSSQEKTTHSMPMETHKKGKVCRLVCDFFPLCSYSGGWVRVKAHHNFHIYNKRRTYVHLTLVCVVFSCHLCSSAFEPDIVHAMPQRMQTS